MTDNTNAPDPEGMSVEEFLDTFGAQMAERLSDAFDRARREAAERDGGTDA